MKKTQRNQAMLAMLEEGKTVTETGAHFGVSRQRVQQIAAANNVFLKFRKTRAVEQFPDLGRMTDREAANVLNVSPMTVFAVRKKLGVRRYLRPIGCEECQRKPYAKGMCRNCYARHLRHRDN
jgi:DNA-binding CsgD family transcriptional regulator